LAAKLRQFALFLLPFALLIAFKIGWDQYNTTSEDFLPQSIHRTDLKGEPRAGKKVVWIVFDELDAGLLNAAAGNGTDIGDLDRLAEQSFVAGNAYSPNNRTQESIPSLLTGVPLQEAQTVAPNDLVLYTRDTGQSFSLRQPPNIFTELAGRGGKSAIVGWYHPYCRVFSDGVSDCFWSPLASANCSGFTAFSRCTQRIFLQALEFVPLATRVFTTLAERNFELLGESRDLQAARNAFLTNKFHVLLAEPDLDLLFFHSSIPHLPIIGRHNSEDENNYSALEVVNDTVRDIRDILEKREEWNDTLVIVSSDHASRLKNARDFEFLPEEEKRAALDDRRVPFIVKLPGQTTRVDYAPTLNTVITKRLILEVLDGKANDPQQLLSWFDELQQNDPHLINRRNTGRKW
jgi:hypothetical protein